MAQVNMEQIQKVANFLKQTDSGEQGLNFYSLKKNKKEIIFSDMYPSLYHPHAIDFFFLVCAHQYGFWYGDEQGYFSPLYGVLNKKKEKGSDLLWKVAKKVFDGDSVRFEPSRLANINIDSFAHDFFSDDNGPILFPDFETRFKLTRSFGRWFVRHNTTPEELVARASGFKCPLKYFLDILREIPGYKDDPLQKKNLLLAMVLANRPEKFLKVTDPQNWRPIIDYHLMRIALRLGLVDFAGEEEKRMNEERRWVDKNFESEIRSDVYEAVEMLIEKSGRTMFFIDNKMWMGRKYCPEVEMPNCTECIFNSVCKKHIWRFQPVYRTTAY